MWHNWELSLWEIPKYESHMWGKNLAHRIPLIKCLSNKISSTAYRCRSEELEQFKFRNPLNAFLHAKRISCILFCPEKQQQKNQPREGLQCAYFEIPSHKDRDSGGPWWGLVAGRWVSIDGLYSIWGLKVSYFMEQLLPKSWAPYWFRSPLH